MITLFWFSCKIHSLALVSLSTILILYLIIKSGILIIIVLNWCLLLILETESEFSITNILKYLYLIAYKFENAWSVMLICINHLAMLKSVPRFISKLIIKPIWFSITSLISSSERCIRMLSIQIQQFPKILSNELHDMKLGMPFLLIFKFSSSSFFEKIKTVKY